MKIAGVTTTPIAVPIDPRRAVIGARGSHTSSPFLIIEVHTDEGVVGIGEVSSTPNWSGEDAMTASRVISAYIAPAIAGMDPTRYVAVASAIEAAVAGNRFTKAGVEMAMWDLAGKAAGMSVARLLGGPQQASVRTKFSVGAFAPDHAGEVAQWAVAQGFDAMKVKVGLDVPTDVERVCAVRDAVGADVLLGVDANGGWRYDEALAASTALTAQANIAFVEQPLDPDDLAAAARLRSRLDVPIIADEAVWDARDVIRIAQAGAADVVSAYVGMSGGIERVRRLVAAAEATGLSWVVGSNLELGPALAAHIHLACSLVPSADAVIPCDIISPFYYSASILTEPLPIEAGIAHALDAPGLGVAIDAGQLQRFRSSEPA